MLYERYTNKQTLNKQTLHSIGINMAILTGHSSHLAPLYGVDALHLQTPQSQYP